MHPTIVLAANTHTANQDCSGKEALFGFFVGQTMQAVQGKGNPGMVDAALRGRSG